MILLTYGTRPEWIKIKPLIEEMSKRNIPFKTLSTGQHKDIAPNDADFNLDFKDFGGNRLDSVLKNCLSIPDNYFDGIDYILVQGDTTSVVGLSLSALNRKIKVIHLEAGLRSFDTENPFPEENNRKIVSSIASIHLCPTQLNAENLRSENIKNNIFIVGNTVLDNLILYKEKCEYSNKVLVTMHRRENHENIIEWFTQINKLAVNYKNLEFILPLHPNPKIKEHQSILTNVKIIDPLSHEDLLDILVKTKIVITDSGGIQEECSFFNKKCLVCRKVTERSESVGINSFLINSPKDLSIIFSTHINDYVIDYVSPYGDGKSAEKICKILKELV